ncbi:MAG TPA: phycocyanobilin lyase [Cyanobacteria bacterium UBA11149]|nr:phycocyanobilin lyase [Cyanobacteria bacterium UBA11367]HBE58290.1 phycocyanobilin lyase [Cyanobacteria bacterium UBA11366]HBK64364.1 phycocyanobilin lyase [Cyanobacteria bacterium UBA11166]HBR73019.1 phycocyanobilin lyase [Cyanobacteria bacterium UBA11159]HBS68895.1 phycocyanobilin lyase [Cyanobacteria bacterium UBA11153]HBW88166.1 phycocyanobilin lyase [Cyanobacteria bacterium UBA11149]HCA97209.1 phycocyanobilin lyase [Cyanobacteria bacterium UBA9226]
MQSGIEQNIEAEYGKSESLTIEEAIANLQGEDRGLRYYAAWWLGKFRVNIPEAITALIAALDDEEDKTPDGGYPLRRNAAVALGKLGDISAVPGLIRCLDCADFYVREKAAESLGMLGISLKANPALRVSIPKLMELLEGGLAQAQPIPGCPHLAQPYGAVMEGLGSLGAKEAIPLIEPFLDHPTELVQYSAARAMYQLTQNPKYGDRLITALSGDKLQLRRAALADLGAIGYVPAADAIAQTLAENSLKIISLKGLLEYQVKNSSSDSPLLSEAAIHIMTLMDDLL